MKSILFAGAALMIGASIYGFVDFSQTKNKNGFREMYTAKDPLPEKTEPVENNDVVTPDENDFTLPEIKEEEKSVKVSEKKKKVQGKKKNRKIEAEMFSRAPLIRENKTGEPITTRVADSKKEN